MNQEDTGKYIRKCNNGKPTKVLLQRRQAFTAMIGMLTRQTQRLTVEARCNNAESASGLISPFASIRFGMLVFCLCTKSATNMP